MLFLQLLADGCVSGLAIGLVAISFSLVYATTGVFHVAHAGLYTLGAYLAWYASTRGLPFALSCALAAAGAAATGALLQKSLYEQLHRRKATPLVFLIASLGALAMLQNAVAMLFTPDILSFPNPWRLEIVDIGGSVTLSYAQLLIVAASLGLFAALLWMSHRTVLGRRIRAVASNPFLAEITRLRPLRIHIYVMVIASAMVAIAGALVGLDQALQPYNGVLILLTATIAVIAGGIRSLVGAFLVSIALAVLQNLSLLVMSGRWSIAVTFGLFIVFIVLRPEGLLKR
jgi:branched-chain amino acid transport system permease protein